MYFIMKVTNDWATGVTLRTIYMYRSTRVMNAQLCPPVHLKDLKERYTQKLNMIAKVIRSIQALAG